MHRPIPVADNIYWVGVNDFDTHLFEAIWPLPRAVSYNSYLILDEKTALVDTVKGAQFPKFLDKIQAALKGRPLDYLIINHMEPDHSGSLKVLQELYPGITIIGNKKTLEYVGNFYHIDTKSLVVGDGQEVSLGSRTVRFYLTPMVHWPETMMTYETRDKILFSGDAFGGFGALGGGIFDDEVDLACFEYETLRYFSNIIGKFSPMVQRALQKLSGLDIKIIASTHGPVYRANPGYILDKYNRWSRYEAEEGVVVAYASMYGNTERMAEATARSLSENGTATIHLRNVSTTHLSYLLTDIWRYKGLILGSCTYNTKLFPLMDQLVRSLDSPLMRTRVVGLFGSYTWSGGGLKGLQEYAAAGKWNVEEPMVEVKSAPTGEDLAKCRELGSRVAQKVKSAPA